MSCIRKKTSIFIKNSFLIEKYWYSEFLGRQLNCSLFFVAVIYVFDAQNGKPLGDGKPITHKVHYHITVVVFRLGFRNGQ